MKPLKLFPVALLAVVLLVALAPALGFLATALFAGEVDSFAWLDWGSRRLQLFGRSLLVAATATALALIWGLATGLAISRLRGALGVLVELLSYLPLLLPNMVIVMGWVYAVGSAGYLTRGLQRLIGLDNAPLNLYSPLGAGFVLSLCYFPFLTVFTNLGFRTVAVHEVRAAELLGGPWRRIWSIWRPRLSPYLATGALLVFLVAFADYGVPAALMVNVYPVEILSQLTSFRDPGEAVALGVPPFILVVSLWLLRHAFLPSAPFPTLRGDRERLRCPRPVLLVALAVIVMSSGLPLLFLAITAGAPEAYVRALKTAGEQVLTSLEVACWGAGISVVLAVLFAFAYRNGGHFWRRAGEGGTYLLLVTPGAVVGLGLLSLRHLPPWSLIGDHAAIVGYVAACRYLAFPALILGITVAAVKPELVQAGAICGARRWRIGSRLLFPLLLPALLAALALSFALTLGELSAAVAVYPPGEMTLPVRLASLLHFGEDSVVAALCLMVSGFVIGLLLLCQLLMNRPLRIATYDEGR